MANGVNPLIGMDFPDPDVIRVGDTYYMISTTMHFFPGGQILRSYDLLHWEICSYLYYTLESTAGETLEEENTIYGHGMWAASLRYHDGLFYAVFIAHEWDRTFLFTAEKPEGPWEKRYIEGIYHDCSLFFDEDGKTYLVYGNREIQLTEMKSDLSAPQPGGLDRIIIQDAPGAFLGYEGSHLYRINGKYVLFLIHSNQQRWFRTQACFISDQLDGQWEGGDVLASDLDGLNSGVAQGGIVDTPDGKWYAVLFQDRGAVGRIPVLIPITWNDCGYPVFGKVSKKINTVSTRNEYQYAPLADSDSFTGEPEHGHSGGGEWAKLKDIWQFNHEPACGYWRIVEGSFRIRTDKLSRSVEYARNTLTQRTREPRCAAEVYVNGINMNDGDVAGICLLTGTYGLIGIERTCSGFDLVTIARNDGKGEEKELNRVSITKSSVRLRVEVDFTDRRDEVCFFWWQDDHWNKAAPAHPIRFTLDHFTGCRFGLFMYSTRKAGGEASFRKFVYTV